MRIKGVLFDFSGTLFRIEPVGTWLRAVLDERGTAVERREFAAYAEGLTLAGALPGGPSPRRIPPELAEVWADRDRSADLHRRAYTGLARQVDLPDPGLYDALYERHMSPAAWQPYPDAATGPGRTPQRRYGGRRGEQHRLGPASGLPRARPGRVGRHLRPVLRGGRPEARSAPVRTACARLGLDPAETA
ncbi:HAD-IA family hydrolase [Streptomyces flavovirens]